MACGDWYGNIRIHDLKSDSLEEVKCIEAHENEVLSIDYSKYTAVKPVFQSQHPESDKIPNNFLVSGSRDTLI